VRRLLELIAVGRATLEHLESALHQPLARRENFEIALLAHDGLAELLQSALEVSELDLDEFEAIGFSHGWRH
jgi:hypothetical protein